MAVALFLLPAAPAAARAGIVLVEDGAPRCAIVLPDDPNRYDKIAAEELVLHFGKMSGAQVPVVRADQVPAGAIPILIGAAATAAMPDLDVDRALGKRVDDMSSRDGFVLRAGANRIALAGVRPPGTAYAASDLLHRLGVRWFFPGELGTIIPKKHTIEIEPFETVQTPSFDLRSMWVCGFGGDRLNKDDTAAGGAIPMWLSRNRQSYDYQWNAQHNMEDTTGDTLDKPEQVDLVAKRILADFDRSPNSEWYSLGWNDSYCRVSNEQALGITHPWYPIPQATDPLIGFYSKVVAKVEQKYPGKKYGFLAYMNYLPAPVTITPHPSLVPVVAPIEQCPRHAPALPGQRSECWQRDALLKSIQDWCAVSNKVLIYDYEPGFLIDGGVPVPCVTRMRTEYPLWHQAGLRGLFAQVQMSVMNNGPNLYVRWRLAWDIDADVDEIMDEYFGMLFGPAARDARAYWDGLENLMAHGHGHQHEDEIMKIVYPIDKVRKLGKHVRRAERRADTNLLRDRVRMITYGYENLMLYVQMREAEDQAEFVKAGKLARKIWALREEIESFNPYFYKIGDLDRMDEDHDFLSLGWAKHNEGRAALTDGTEGDLVAMLPDEWSFTTDPRDLGVIKRWYALEAAPRNWRKIRVSRIWEVQGLEDERGRGYDGVAWYFTRVKVPAGFAGRKIHMNFGGVFGKMLIWANGEFGHYRPWTGPWWQNVMNTAFDVDLTDVLEPGQVNTIAIRVDNEFEWGGIFRRVFLYAPIASAD